MKINELVQENDMSSFLKDLQKNNPKFKNLRIHGDPEHDELRRQDAEKRETDRAVAHQKSQDAQAQDHADLPHLEAEYAKMKKEYEALGGSDWQYADREQNLSAGERKARSMESGLHHLANRIRRAKKHGEQGMAEEDWAPPGYGSGKPATNPNGTASAQRQADRAWDALQYQRSLNPGQFKPLVPGKPMGESATAGATSSANIGTVDAPHLSPGKARGKKSYIGSPGKSGTTPPPQPKVNQPKNKDGTAKNGLDIKGASLFGGPPIKRR